MTEMHAPKPESDRARSTRDGLNEAFARIGKAVANPRRIELLGLLSQTERSVEALATVSGLTVGNTSAHLQVLRQARLVETRREGTTIYYRIAGDDVLSLLAAVRTVAANRLAEVERIARDSFGEFADLRPIGRQELSALLARKAAVVVDVRPREEFDAGHIPGALSIPLDELDRAATELPVDAEVIVYCRGRYCMLAPQAVSVLAASGIASRPLDGGLPDWRLDGYPVASGDQASR